MRRFRDCFFDRGLLQLLVNLLEEPALFIRDGLSTAAASVVPGAASSTLDCHILESSSSLLLLSYAMLVEKDAEHAACTES